MMKSFILVFIRWPNTFSFFALIVKDRTVRMASALVNGGRRHLLKSRVHASRDACNDRLWHEKVSMGRGALHFPKANGLARNIPAHFARPKLMASKRSY